MADWPEQAKEIITGNTEFFTAKLLTRKIACRRFSQEVELIDALSALLKTNAPNINKPSKRDLLTEELHNYLNKKQFKAEIKSIVMQTFKDLHLIS
jgi:hypothetical protein